MQSDAYRIHREAANVEETINSLGWAVIANRVLQMRDAVIEQILSGGLNEKEYANKTGVLQAYNELLALPRELVDRTNDVELIDD